MPEGNLLSFLILGFLLGARHALDPDHVVAVATMVSHRPALHTSGRIGLSWGLGHTFTLSLVCLTVIALGISIPVAVAKTMEIGVGIMLVVLGTSLAVTMCRECWHVHMHQHGEENHVHLHSHCDQPDHVHPHWARLSVKPFIVGTMHGLAGSSAIVLAVAAAAGSIWSGLSYVFAFGVGSILGMVLLGLAMSVPLVVAVPHGRHAQLVIQGLASLCSVALGLSMIYRLGLHGPS